MKKIHYNKLVRDKIPDIISAENKISKTRILDDEEFLKRLKEKLLEEVMEFIKTPNIQELADITEVIYTLCITLGYNLDNLNRVRLDKLNTHGGFDNKLFLEYVE